jgi:Ca2+/Na+ antiporter
MPPPPPVSHGVPPLGQTTRLGGLSTVTAIVLAVATVGGVLPMAVTVFQRSGAYGDFVAGTLSETELVSLDVTVGRWTLATLLLTVVAGIVFIVWQFQYARNAVALRGPLSLGPAWAIAGWLIPLANLVLPFMQLNSSTKASDPAWPRGQHGIGTVPGTQRAWTILYLCALGLFVFSSHDTNSPQLFESKESIADRFAASDQLAAFALLLYATAGLFAIWMVRELTQRQQLAIARASSTAS